MITTTDFGTLCDGRTVRLYTLKNDAIELSVTDYGSTLVRLLVPDKNGKPTDVVLGVMILQAMWPMTPALEIMSAEAPIVSEVLHLH